MHGWASLPHAHDAVAAGGEINVLDPAGYGSLVILKSISIQGHGWASVSGVSGVTVAGGQLNVLLRGLILEGSGGGTPFANDGVSFQASGSLTIQDSIIRGFGGNGLNFGPTASATLLISDTRFLDNILAGVIVEPQTQSASVLVNGAFDHVVSENNGDDGISLNVFGATMRFSLDNCVMSNNVGGDGHGLDVTSGGTADILVQRSVISNNKLGIFVTPSATVRLTKSAVTGNQTGLTIAANGGVLVSYGDNIIDGNIVPGDAPTIHAGQ